MCVYGVVLINILVLQLGPPKQKFLAPPLLASYALEIKGNAKHEYRALTGKVKANNAPPIPAQSGGK